MDIKRSHMKWGSDINKLDNSSMMFAADCNTAPLGYYQRLLLDEDMIPPHSDNAQVDYANVLQNQNDLEQLDSECAPEVNGDPSQQLQSSEPAQQLTWESSQELRCPSTSETIPECPSIDQSEETNESGEGNEFEEEVLDQSAESDGECSNDHINKCTGGFTFLPKLPSGKKIGVSYHKKNKQWEAHLWIKGQQLRGREKKGVQIFLGNFETEEEAKLAHDRAAIKLKMQPSARGKPYPLNFPAAVHASYMEEHAGWTTRDFLWKIRCTSNKFSKGKSKLKGVSVRTQSVKHGREWVAKYESQLSLKAKEFGDDKKRTFILGNFENEEEAGQAYDRALMFLHQHLPEVEQLRCITNFRPSTYSASDIEAMASKLPSRLLRLQ